MSTTEPILFKSFKILWVHQGMDRELENQVIRLWQDNRVLKQQEALRRASEVACVVLNSESEVVGVNTVYTSRLKADGEVFWFYRVFIAPQFRTPGLPSKLFEITRDNLENESKEKAAAPAGIVAVAENSRLKSPSARRTMEGLGLRPVGATADGSEIWMLKFNS